MHKEHLLTSLSPSDLGTLSRCFDDDDLKRSLGDGDVDALCLRYEDEAVSGGGLWSNLVEQLEDTAAEGSASTQT